MIKFIVELWLDGYKDEKMMEEALEHFIYDKLNFPESSINITKITDDLDVDTIMMICRRPNPNIIPPKYDKVTEGYDPDQVNQEVHLFGDHIREVIRAFKKVKK